MKRRNFLGALGWAAAQEPEPDWVCPMDPDVRSKTPGLCPRCRMALVAGIPAPVEYPLRVNVEPRAWLPGQRIRMRFEVTEPGTGARARRLELIHERYFHLFLVSGDLEYFAHEHPEPQPDGSFLFETVLPKAGFYRLLSDFYPSGGTPQMAVKTIISAGTRQTDFVAPELKPDLAPKQGTNLRASLRTEPADVLAGLKTQLHLELDPGEGMEPYLGAWGHLLCASADLVDLIHTHPFIADGGPRVQFNVVFPRPGVYRLWPQFQRRGVVNTVRFDVGVRGL
jgi:hypothetical protein